MRRYDEVPVQIRWDGKRVYKVADYPIIPVQDTDLLVVTNTEDYLDALAYKYYGDPTLFWVIARANNLGKGRLSVPPGLTLRIPVDISSILGEFSRLNSET